eukprot:7390490-Prymnesium_polylepis.3
MGIPPVTPYIESFIDGTKDRGCRYRFFHPSRGRCGTEKKQIHIWPSIPYVLKEYCTCTADYHGC